MQIVVAGAGGFIGSEVVDRALAAGHQVFALVRDQTSARFDPEALKAGRLVTLPLGADPEVLARGFGLEPGATWIVAAGVNRGRDPEVLREAHGTLLRELLDSAEALSAQRVVLLGCLGAEAGTQDAWTTSKLAAEAALRAGSRPWTLLRSGPVYGIGDSLLDEVGAWMRRSPFIPRFLEAVPLQPVHVGNVAEALLASGPGEFDIGGEVLTWGDLLRACAEAAGKSLVGPRLSDATLAWVARTLGDQSWARELVPFDSDALARHRRGYLTRENALPRLLGRDPRPLADYLANEWAYRANL